MLIALRMQRRINTASNRFRIRRCFPLQSAAMSVTYERWLEFVFNNPVREPEWYWDEDFDTRWAALELTDTFIVQCMTRLFLRPEVLNSYSLDQVEQGLWFLIGGSSPGRSSEALLRRESLLSERVACIHAISSFFRNFVVVVTDAEYDPRENCRESLTCVCYMWWDIFPMHFYLRRQIPGGVVLPPNLRELLDKHERGSLNTSAERGKLEIEAEIHEATLQVMAEMLDLPSELCQFSALHGLGHWHSRHPERVEQIVDSFVSRHKNLRPYLIEYASDARFGRVL